MIGLSRRLLERSAASMAPVVWTSVVLALSGLTGCATQVPLPDRVQTTAGAYDARYIEQVDFSYVPPQPLSFSKVKLCVAEHVDNRGATLQDSAGSFVGAATGTYYRNQRTQTVGGEPVFKYVDESAATLIASGLTRTASSGFVVDLVRFDLRAATGPKGFTLVFSRIERAQQNTGSLANDGFGPVGTWPGARAPEVYAALEQLASRLKTCMV